MVPCHSLPQANALATGNIALMGQPNVGKSVLFQRLTGHYVTVSNYPGTTVEVARSAASFLPDAAVIDTPGLIAFPPRSEDEQVVARVLLRESLRAIVQVGDAKNLRRTLLLTIQLAEMGVPLTLALNMMDEADAHGVQIDHAALGEHLDLTVVPTIATRGKGVKELTAAIQSAHVPQFRITYPTEIETALAELVQALPGAPIATRALALLWLCGDCVTEEWLRERLTGVVLQKAIALREALQLKFVESLSMVVQRARLAYVEQVVASVLSEAGSHSRGVTVWLGHIAIHPIWGLPFLALVLYTLYWFVGVFGAGDLVGWLEENLFGEMINPWVTEQINNLIPLPLVAEILVGEYGLWTMGMTYALALILPIVTTFFLAFSLLEDSGYLPRLSVLANRIFEAMGLNGKAVLPMVLGLGCVTMATMTTRILDSKRDRLLVTLFLALAIPCSAQLGVVLGMLASVSLGATLIWASAVVAVLLIVGALAARLAPGERSMLLMELPPLRLPVLSNVLIKTFARLEWYLKEVIPLFLLGTAILFVLDKLGILPWLIVAGKPLVSGWLGLPAEASSAFLLGFLRRDFGATGLFVMEAQGLLSPAQVVVAMVTITLFIPCVASVMMIARERGTRAAVGMVAFVFPLSFFVGGILYRLLTAVGWNG